MNTILGFTESGYTYFEMGPSSNFLYNNSEKNSISEIYLMRFIYILKNSAIRLNDKNEIIFFLLTPQ